MTVAAMLLDGRYLLHEEIGAGGFCEVWRATDTLLTRPVAVKLLHAAYAHHPEARARFKVEARHAGALAHKNIARVYDYGEPERGESYLVMELIEGPSLDVTLADGPLDAARTMDIVAQVAAGLQAAHGAGVIHRDIKPSNIMFTADGTVRITDFGVAHSVGSAPLTATGMVVGSPGYIAPERVTGGQGGPASDLYALGIVAYECLAGTRPFPGSPLEVAIAHRDRPLPPLPAWVPVEVADFVMVLTAKDPAWRPASAGEVAAQARRLRDELVSGTIRARRSSADTPPMITPVQGGIGGLLAVPPPARGARLRRPRPLGAAALALAAVAGLSLVTVKGLESAAHPAARPVQTAPPAATPAPAGTPAKAHPARQQSPHGHTRVLVASGQAPGTGPPGHHKRPGDGQGTSPDPGQGSPSGPGGGGGHGHGNGPGHGRASASSA